jgi:Arc/MetJ-type ribon-helix-helix transcriptional regulator
LIDVRDSDGKNPRPFESSFRVGWGCDGRTVGINHGERQMPAMTEYTTVSIPKELAARVEDTLEGTTFSSTSDLVRFLLRSIVIQHERSGGDLSESEFQEIAEQLADLGYLR